MIKTDKVIYRTRTLGEYNWLMKKLEADGFTWDDGNLPTEVNNWRWYFNETCIDFKDKIITSGDSDLYENDQDYKDYEFIEVSDLMESEKKTITNEPIEQVDKPQKIKKIIYNIEVYFE